MKPDFANMLYTLRREKNLSQREAAGDLGISQALLSHYENGIREPRLDFVVRACEYYGVSTDYVLGRTAEKGQNVLPSCEIGEARNFSRVAALILSVLAGIDDEKLLRSSSRYMCLALYNLICALREPDGPYEPLRDAAIKASECAVLCEARRVGASREIAAKLSDEELDLPELFSYLSELESLMEKTEKYDIKKPDESK